MALPDIDKLTQQNTRNVKSYISFCETNYPYSSITSINPFQGDTYLKYTFKDGEHPQTVEHNQEIIDLVEDNSTMIAGNSFLISRVNVILGSGATDCNTDTGVDDWGLLVEGEDYVAGGDSNDFGWINKASTDYLICTGGGTGYGAPYAFSPMAGQFMGNNNMYTDPLQTGGFIWIPPAWVVDVVMDTSN